MTPEQLLKAEQLLNDLSENYDIYKTDPTVLTIDDFRLLIDVYGYLKPMKDSFLEFRDYIDRIDKNNACSEPQSMTYKRILITIEKIMEKNLCPHP